MTNLTALTTALGKKRFKFAEPLAAHTYFKLGGPADLFAVATTTDELLELVRGALAHKVPYMVLGGGSNVLITDAGYRGLIIKNKTSKIQLKSFSGQVKKASGDSHSSGIDLKEVVIQADSGVPANQLIRYSLDEGLAGLEDFLGLPGSVGGAIYNNSHHLGKLIGDLVVEVSTLNQSGKVISLQPKELKFAYDYSVFHETNNTILTASFQLKRADKTALWERANAAVKRRATTQPLGAPSSGCIFRNISIADAMRLGTPDQTCSVGYLIDRAGLKGERIGGAVISDIHANFIVNDGKATASDVLKLIELVKTKIKTDYGVNLEEEIVIIGEK